MFRMLIDTCVWLDLAKDPKQVPVLGVVEELLRLGMVSLIVPRVVLDEFRRNRERIAKESVKSLSTHFRLVKEAVGKIGGDKKKGSVLKVEMTAQLRSLTAFKTEACGLPRTVYLHI
jgi:hypothetical protein